MQEQIILEQKDQDSLLIGTLKLNELFEYPEVNLTIPDYQRPYVWTEDHISELLEDWNDHFFKDGTFKESSIEYFMGSIMLHKNESQYEIIDGQQRLTTLLIMDFVWNRENSILRKGHFNFNYTSNISAYHIKANRKYLETIRSGVIARRFNQITKKLVLSIIITDSEDDAFVFFESQNNRGVPLDEIDFFKSYHLRELNHHHDYLRHFAKKFDQINALNNSRVHDQPNLKSLNELFVKQLWRIRFWSKNDLKFATRTSLLATFQKNTLVFGAVDDIKLYPSFNNTLGNSLKFNKAMQPEIRSTIRLYGSSSIDIPFTINQPIQRGIGFFLYADKYTSLFNHIFRDREILEIDKLTNLVYKLYNDYFINLYQMAVVTYYDKFRKAEIGVFVKWLEHYMGAFRMNRSSIVAQSPIVLLRDYGNIFQIIEQSYLSSEVIFNLKKAIPESYYEGFSYRIQENEVTIYLSGDNQTKLSRARQNYYQLVKDFYKPCDHNYQLNEKKNWINESLK